MATTGNLSARVVAGLEEAEVQSDDFPLRLEDLAGSLREQLFRRGPALAVEHGELGRHGEEQRVLIPVGRVDQAVLEVVAEVVLLYAVTPALQKEAEVVRIEPVVAGGRLQVVQHGFVAVVDLVAEA